MNALPEAPPMVTADGMPIDEHGEQTDPPRFGISLEAGVPDGIGAAVSTNPVSWLRVQLAGLTNTGSGGVRLGFVISPWAKFNAHVWPILGVDGGYFFPASANWVPGLPDNATLHQTLNHVSYGFANVQAGLELGSKAFCFIIRGGLSYLDVQLGSSTTDLNGATLRVNGLNVRAVIPSARVGFLFSFS